MIGEKIPKLHWKTRAAICRGKKIIKDWLNFEYKACNNDRYLKVHEKNGGVMIK